MAVAEFFVAYVFVGALIAGAIVVGSELGAATEIPFLHPTILAGVFVAGGIILLMGPWMILPAVVAGIAAAEALVQARSMRDPEKQFATEIFGEDTLPIGRILITNFDSDGTAITTPNADGSILICLGDRFDDPLASADSRTTLIHELTHAWQIKHYPVGAEVFWQGALNHIKGRAEPYEGSNPDGRPWSGFGIEQQAYIVATQWYYPHAEYARPVNDPNFNLHEALNSEAALNDPYFRYIQDNIRLGVP